MQYGKSKRTSRNILRCRSNFSLDTMKMHAKVTNNHKENSCGSESVLYAVCRVALIQSNL